MFLFLSLKHRRAGRTMNGLTYTQLARESWPTRRTRTQGSKATLSSPFHADGAWSHHRSLASTHTAVCTDLPDLVAPIRIPPARTRNFALYTRDLDDNITNYWQMSILVKKNHELYISKKKMNIIFSKEKIEISSNNISKKHDILKMNSINSRTSRYSLFWNMYHCSKSLFIPAYYVQWKVPPRYSLPSTQYKTWPKITLLVHRLEGAIKTKK